MSQLQGYGYVSDSDESLKSKSGAKFGGNFGVAVLAKFAYSANVAKESQEPREAIEVVVKVGDREYKDWINPVNRVVDKNNVEIYENDSVRMLGGEYFQGHKEYDITGTIEWQGCGFDLVKDKTGYNLCFCDYDTLEVIGHVYKNNTPKE